MANHLTNITPLVLGRNEVEPTLDEAARDARLDRMWAAHRVLATGTKGHHIVAMSASAR